MDFTGEGQDMEGVSSYGGDAQASVGLSPSATKFAKKPPRFKGVPTHEIVKNLRFRKYKNPGAVSEMMDPKPKIHPPNSGPVSKIADPSSRVHNSNDVNIQGGSGTSLNDRNVKPGPRKMQDSGAAVARMDNKHLEVPILPGVNNQSESGALHIASVNKPRNSPQIHKEVPMQVDVGPQPIPNIAVRFVMKRERMQGLGNESLRSGTHTSVDIVSPESTSYAKKRPRKAKGAPADDVAMSKLRPRHSQDSGDFRGRDVTMSTDADTQVGSSCSQIAKVKVRRQKSKNSDGNEGMYNTNSDIPAPKGVNTSDADRPRGEKKTSDAKLKQAKFNLVPANVDAAQNGSLRGEGPKALPPVSPQQQSGSTTVAHSLTVKKQKGKGRAPTEPMMGMDERQATSSGTFLPQSEPTSSMAPLASPPAEGSSSTAAEKTRQPRKAKGPATGEPKAKRVKFNVTSTTAPALAHENGQSMTPFPAYEARTSSASIKMKWKAKDPTPGGPITNEVQVDTTASSGPSINHENPLASGSTPSTGNADVPGPSSTTITGHNDEAQAGRKPRRTRKAKEPASGEPKAKRVKQDPATTQEGPLGITEAAEASSASTVVKRGRPKKEKDPANSTTVKVPKQKRAKKAIENDGATVADTQKATPPVTAPKPKPPTWKVVPIRRSKAKKVKPIPTEAQTGEADSIDAAPPTMKPRIWSSSREELLAVMPELAGTKCVNGVSWVCSPNPFILLEEVGKCFGVSAVGDEKRVLELTTTRDFVCATEGLLPEAPSMGSTSHSPTLAASEAQVGESSAANMDVDAPPNVPTAKDPSVEVQPLAEYGDILTKVAESLDVEFGPITPPPPVSDALPMKDVVIPMLCSSCTRHYNPLGCKSCVPVAHPTETHELNKEPPTPVFVPEAKVIVSYDKGKGCSSQTSEVHREGSAVDHQEQVIRAPLSSTRNDSEHSQGLPRPSGDIALHSSSVPSQDAMAPLEHSPSSLTPNPTVEEDQQVKSSSMDHCPPAIHDPAPECSASPPRRKEPAQTAGRVPVSLPEELQVLVDAYTQCIPLTVIAARSCILDTWPNIPLPEEFALVFLGYFKVLSVKEAPTEVDQPASLASGMLAGRMEWRFKLEWISGGEEWLVRPTEFPIDYSRPWWDPPEVSKVPEAQFQTMPQSEPTPMRPDLDIVEQMQHMEISPNKSPEPAHPLVDSTDDSAARYRAEKGSHDIWDQLGDIFYSQISSHFVIPFGSSHSVPSGWYCVECGKLNFQSTFRHRRCSSSVCKASSMPPGFALNLSVIRDHHDAQPLPLPYNTFPEGVQARIATWGDGMRTLTYTLEGVQKGLKSESQSQSAVVVPMIKHVFTCNLPQQQVAATQLFMDIQSSVVLKRTVGDGNAIFTYSCHIAPLPESNSRTGKEKKLPLCLIQAKDLLVSKASVYAEVESSLLEIGRMDVLAWASSGSQRGIHSASATTKNVVIMCLGCEAVLTFLPIGGGTLRVVGKKAKLPTTPKKTKEGKMASKGGKGKAKAKGKARHLPTDSQPSGSGLASATPADTSMAIGQVTERVQTLDLDSLIPMEDDEEDVNMMIGWGSDDYLPPKGAELLRLVGPAWPGTPLASTSNIVPRSSQSMAIPPFPILDPNSSTFIQTSAMVTPTPASTSSLVLGGPDPEPASFLAPDLDSLIRMDDGEDHDGGTGDVEMRDAEMLGPSTQPQLDPDAEEDEEPDKADPENVVVTLVHGDVLVLSGAEFEYSIKRIGTSILLIGSYDSSVSTTNKEAL